MSDTPTTSPKNKETSMFHETRFGVFGINNDGTTYGHPKDGLEVLCVDSNRRACVFRSRDAAEDEVVRQREVFDQPNPQIREVIIAG